MKHIVIGTGPAGVVAAETLRKRSPESDVVLIGNEPEPPYSRMAIPYHLIGNIQEQGTYLRKTDNHFDTLGIEVVQKHVQSINKDNNSLSLDNGDSLSFDKLLLATGSSPVKPPIEGMDLPGVVNCWTMDDARKIIEGTQPGDDVVLMGAGFIGCIILEALAQRGVNLTVIEMENRMVPRMMDEQSGGLIKSWCESKGVRVLTSTKVTGVHQEKKTTSSQSTSKRSDNASSSGFFAKIKQMVSKESPSSPEPVETPTGKLVVNIDGESSSEPLVVDLLICATGVRPNIDLATGLLETNSGILINENLQTSHPDIYAAGDVAEGKDFSTGGYSVQAIQPTAVDHGYMAAINMTSGNEVLHQGSINMNVLDTMGLISSSFGLWEGINGGDSCELNDPKRYQYINLQFEDDILVGANTLGLTQHVGVLRGLIHNRTHLGKWKQKLMDNPTRVMEAYLAHHVP